MPTLLLTTIGVILASHIGDGAARVVADEQIRFQLHHDRVIIKYEKQPLATYVFQDSKTPRPYFAHVFAPNGKQVTRHHPPRPGQDATDHATFHPGIWMAFGDINGQDYWRLKARVEHAGFIDSPINKSGQASFSVRNQYWDEAGKKIVCIEVAKYSFQALHSDDSSRTPTGFLLYWDSTFSSSTGAFSFGDQEEMGLGIRVTTPITVTQGGQIRNRDGLINEKQVWGKMSAWCDYSGLVDNHRIGITLMPDPANFRRCWYHARDYGFCAANPFGRNAFTRGEKSKITVANGASLKLRFGILLHAQPKDEPRRDLDLAYRVYLDQLKNKDLGSPSDE
ncbi:MAG: DUF6807 family protein [Planctomycetota bacterium]|nr:DUF6807 family protein [Planctomycetota bacterium]